MSGRPRKKGSEREGERESMTLPFRLLDTYADNVHVWELASYQPGISSWLAGIDVVYSTQPHRADSGAARTSPRAGLAVPRLNRIQHHKTTATNQEVVKNTALETSAYTKAILVKPWQAAHNNDRHK